MSKDIAYYEKRAKIIGDRIQRRRQKTLADIRDGVIKGKIVKTSKGEHPIVWHPKGIQHYYDTRTLINMVEDRMDRIEAYNGQRYCPINGRWMLQIRGKHLRRLLKARPDWKQVGRRIVDTKHAINTPDQERA